MMSSDLITGKEIIALLSLLGHYGMKSQHVRKNSVNCTVLYEEVSILLNAAPPSFIKRGKTSHLFGLFSTSLPCPQLQLGAAS